MRVLYWIVLALAALALALFAASNRSAGRARFLAVRPGPRTAAVSGDPADLFRRLCCAARWRPGPADGIGGARHASGGGASPRSKASWRRRRRGWPDRHCRPATRRRSAASDLVPPAIPPHAAGRPAGTGSGARLRTQAGAHRRCRGDPPPARFPEPDRGAERNVPRRRRGAAAPSSCDRPRAAAGRQSRHIAADAGVADRGGARGQDRHRVSRQCRARASFRPRHLSAARRRDRHAQSRARRHGADLAPHGGGLGARRLVSRPREQRRASDGRHRRARAVSDRGACRGAADPRDPIWGRDPQRPPPWPRALPLPGPPPSPYPISPRPPLRPTSSPAPRCRPSRWCGARGSNPARISTWSAPTARTCARPTTTPIRRARVFVDTEAALARSRRYRPAAALRRARARRASPATCSGWLAGPARDGEPPTRSRCSNRSAPRSKTSPPPGWRSAAWSLMNIVANFAKFMGHYRCSDEALRLRDAAVRGHDATHTGKLAAD